jgi:hypothetical protein
MAKINPIEVQKALKGVNYPAKKDDIVRNAKEQGADDEIVRALENLSADEFESPTDINEAIGKQS